MKSADSRIRCYLVLITIWTGCRIAWQANRQAASCADAAAGRHVGWGEDGPRCGLQPLRSPFDSGPSLGPARLAAGPYKPSVPVQLRAGPITLYVAWLLGARYPLPMWTFFRPLRHRGRCAPPPSGGCVVRIPSAHPAVSAVGLVPLVVRPCDL
jgi:hypothetical protein